MTNTLIYIGLGFNRILCSRFLKASISASTMFKNFLFSGEYELIDYTKTKFFTANFEEENAIIKNIYMFDILSLVTLCVLEALALHELA